MKKFLLFATALTGFAVVAQAQEATTVKTTTVQYQVPTCTNCRTTTQVRTVYPEPAPRCATCAQPVVRPVPVVREERRKCGVGRDCKDNHELGIRNPLFVLKQGQFSAQAVGSLYKEPKRPVRPKSYDENGERNMYGEWRGYDAHTRLSYGITDKWTISALGGTQYSTPKTAQYRAALKAAGMPEGPIPHNSSYDVTLGTYYHIIDLCHLDVIAGVEGTWHRHKMKTGDNVDRVNGWSWDPTVTIGSTWGWFTPYVTANYTWDRTKVKKDEGEEIGKSWKKEHGYYVNPGLYIQPSKWYAFDFNWQKMQRSKNKPQWNAGIDFYPYKNVTFGAQFNARRPYAHPMDMFGVSADAKIVF